MQTLQVPSLLNDYLPLVIFIGVAAFIGLALLIAPFAIAYSNPDPEKLSAYECGFNAFDDARMKFDVRFYLVAILFIIFDLEVAFPLPLGRRLWGARLVWFLLDDDLSGRSDRRFRLRVAQGRPGVGLIVRSQT